MNGTKTFDCVIPASDYETLTNSTNGVLFRSFAYLVLIINFFKKKIFGEKHQKERQKILLLNNVSWRVVQYHGITAQKMNFSIEDFFILCTVYFLDNLQNDAYDSALLQLIGRLLNKSEAKFQMFQYFLIYS